MSKRRTGKSDIATKFIVWLTVADKLVELIKHILK